jgi:hypothetical protein
MVDATAAVGCHVEITAFGLARITESGYLNLSLLQSSFNQCVFVADCSEHVWVLYDGPCSCKSLKPLTAQRLVAARDKVRDGRRHGQAKGGPAGK